MNNYFYRRLDNDDELINNAEKKTTRFHSS